MLGCQQWSGKPEAGRGSRFRKSEALGDLEGRQRELSPPGAETAVRVQCATGWWLW